MNLSKLTILTTFFLACSFITCSDVSGNALPAPAEENASDKNFSKLDLREFTLKNGMKVLLKHTNFEDDEISVKMTALGGYAAMPSGHRASAELTPQIVVESGVGDYCCDKLSVLLWKNSVEFEVKVNPYSRVIQGSARPETVETLLNIINLYFTRPHFSQKGLESVKTGTMESIKKRSSDHDTAFEDVYRSLNSENFHALRPLSLTDLEKIDLNIVKEFYSKAFGNPSDFVIVIVGNFNKETIQDHVEKFLGTIPTNADKFDTQIKKYPHFPDGTSSRNVKVKTRVHCLTRLTFPVRVDMDENKFWALDLACQVIETRLRKVIINKMKSSYAIDVSYEFPMYPKLDKPWLSIQYKCEPEKNGMMRKLILAELQQLQDGGPTKEELEQVRKLMIKSDDYWLTDNDYWVAVLSNYYSWGWDPTGMIKNYNKEPFLELENMKNILKTYISIDNYSKLSAKPGH